MATVGSVLQCGASCCSVLQYSHCSFWCLYCRGYCWQVCCIVLQCVAVDLMYICAYTYAFICVFVCVTMYFHVSCMYVWIINIYVSSHVCGSVLLHVALRIISMYVSLCACCSVLQCVAVCFSVLRCIAVCCSVYHQYICNSRMYLDVCGACVAACWRVLACVAVCRNLLQMRCSVLLC